MKNTIKLNKETNFSFFSCAFKVLVFFFAVISLCSCHKEPIDGTYQFIVYAPDSNNNDLSDNTVVATYSISYYQKTYVIDTLKQDGNKYYFPGDDTNYIVLENGSFGYYITNGYFENYEPCADGEIDMSWSKSLVNNAEAYTSFGDTPLVGLESFALIIDGWK